MFGTLKFLDADCPVSDVQSPLICHCFADFDIVVYSKWKPNKWTAVNIKHMTLKGLKDYIVRKMYQPSALENDGAELNFMNDRDKYSPWND